ncbi:hypothetical protein [Xylocopilactobacillus apicola]|uniref:hypothetical protein n=1 Tax=Xylocopilactobacillus apicola TaxID=2932184 RepID=UPI002953BEDC|nr:hypothetical protein [Xylocopilactobacillus apicola]
MKITNKLKLENNLILQVIAQIAVFIGAAFFLSKRHLIKLDFNICWISLWLIILFSLNQIKGENKFNKLDFILAWGSLILVIIFTIQHSFFVAFISIITTILLTVKTPNTLQLNKLSAQIGLWIFALCEVVYMLNGAINLAILEKIFLIFIADQFFKKFLIKRKISTYAALVAIGIISTFIFKNSTFYLILQLLVPIIPKKIESPSFWELLYLLISYGTI